MLLGFSRRNVVRRASQKSRRRASTRRRHLFDYLEDRRLLSGGQLSTAAAWAQAPGGTQTAIQTTYYGASNGTGNVLGTGSTGPEASPRSVAMDQNGNSAIVWAAQQSNGTWNLMLQQDDADGNTIESPTRVANSNLEIVMVARQQTISATSSNLAVVWDAQTGSSRSGPVYATYAQLYHASYDGTSWSTAAVGGKILVGGSGNHIAGSVAMDAAGDFDVLYATPGSGLSYGSYNWSVQRYAATGAANGKPISVAATNWEGNGGGEQAALAMDANGDFAVAYQRYSNGYVIDAQTFNSSGKATSGVIQVNATSTDLMDQADVAMDSAGDFVVTWNETPSNGGWGRVYARVFYATNGQPNGLSTAPLQETTPILYTAANGYTYATNAAYNYQPAAVVMQPNGGGAFDLAWTAFTNDAPGVDGYVFGSYYDVFAQAFDSSGAPAKDSSGNVIGPITVYQSQTYESNFFPAGWPSAAIDGNNDLLVVYSVAPQDSPPPGFAGGEVFAQFYPDPPATSLQAADSSAPTSGTDLTSGSATSAADSVFGAHAYPENDDSLA